MAAKPTIILLLGTTASGKSSAAMELAPRLNAEILSIDSMQVYRRMDLGTAKPTPAERSRVVHHLIDVAEPSEQFSVARYVELADRAISDITDRGKKVLAAGGTPLYLMGLMRGLFDGPPADPTIRAELRERADRDGLDALHAELQRVDPVAAERIHRNDLKRIERAIEVWRITGRPLSAQQTQWDAPYRYQGVVVGIRRAKEDASQRINARVQQMIRDGLVDEVRTLLAEPQGLGPQARQALGYAEIIRHLAGECTLDEAVEQIKIGTRHLAKHQRTWFQKFTDTRWVDVLPNDQAAISNQLFEAISEKLRALSG